MAGPCSKAGGRRSHRGSSLAGWVLLRPWLLLLFPEAGQPRHSPETLTHWVSAGLPCCPLASGGTPPPRQGLLTATCPDDALPVPAVPPSVLLDEIEAAELEGNDGRIEGVLCGAVKQLKATRAKPDGALYLSLMYLAKIKPNIFATEGVIEVRAGWLE